MVQMTTGQVSVKSRGGAVLKVSAAWDNTVPATLPVAFHLSSLLVYIKISLVLFYSFCFRRSP